MFKPFQSNVMDTSHFENYEFDPHGNEGSTLLEDSSGVDWISGF